MISRKPSTINVFTSDIAANSSDNSTANDSYNAKAKTSIESPPILSPALRISPPMYNKLNTLRNSPPLYTSSKLSTNSQSQSMLYNENLKANNNNKKNFILRFISGFNGSSLTRFFAFICVFGVITYFLVFISMTSLASNRQINSSMLHRKRNMNKVTILLNTFKRHDLVEG